MQGHFVETKKEQIEHYIEQVKKCETVKIGEKKYPLRKMKKQIWIITQEDQGNSIIYQDPLIVVKEVFFRDLIGIYYDRLFQELSETKLCGLLKKL